MGVKFCLASLVLWKPYIMTVLHHQLMSNHYEPELANTDFFLDVPE